MLFIFCVGNKAREYVKDIYDTARMHIIDDAIVGWKCDKKRSTLLYTKYNIKHKGIEIYL